MITLSHDGRTQRIREWAAELGIDPGVIRQRLRKGWTVAAALNPNDTRGAHQIGRKWPEWVKKRISEGARRSRPVNPRPVRVPLFNLDYEEADGSLVYADPLVLLCACETVNERMKI